VNHVKRDTRLEVAPIEVGLTSLDHSRDHDVDKEYFTTGRIS